MDVQLGISYLKREQLLGQTPPSTGRTTRHLNSFDCVFRDLLTIENIQSTEILTGEEMIDGRVRNRWAIV